jgi:Uma2 family endonuclease
VQVLSPDDPPSEIRTKVADYLERGVPLVVLIDPDERIVTVHRGSAPPITLGTGDLLDLNEVIQGFHCPVRDIFE